jgi:hypothetical protein
MLAAWGNLRPLPRAALTSGTLMAVGDACCQCIQQTRTQHKQQLKLDLHRTACFGVIGTMATVLARFLTRLAMLCTLWSSTPHSTPHSTAEAAGAEKEQWRQQQQQQGIRNAFFAVAAYSHPTLRPCPLKFDCCNVVPVCNQRRSNPTWPVLLYWF